MKPLGLHLVFVITSCHHSKAFLPSVVPSTSVPRTRTSTLLFSATTVQPSETSAIGTIGSGYLPLLAAKLAAHRQHAKSWIISSPSEIDVMRQLSSTADDDGSLTSLEFVFASDTSRIKELLSVTDALMFANDDVNEAVDTSVINYILDPAKATKIKRVVAMSRNLNGSGMGMFVSASQKAANAQVWDNSNKDAYLQYENDIQKAAQNCGADWTIVRAGTLKGGACGENNMYPTYLAQSYYELSKNDVTQWQLLFDINVRGVKLAKGDVLSGPGVKAVFTATGTEEHEGDSGRCGVAEAMVRSLELEGAANVDFGVGTSARRDVPSEEEWEELFRGCLS